MKLTLLLTALMTLGLTSSTAIYAGEPTSYRYRLVESKDDQLCRRMTTVYNEHFSHPFEARTLSKLQKESSIPIHSRYPSSVEFDSIKWDLKTYPLTRPDGRKETWSALIARFDVDNDGMEDVVAKASFFRGDPDDSEELYVFSGQDFDLNAVKDAKEFLEGQRASKRPSVINVGAAILRPFVANGKTYLSGYDYKRYTPLPGAEAAKNAPHTPPQYMHIYRYEGGGQMFAGAENQLRVTEMCTINMSQVK